MGLFDPKSLGLDKIIDDLKRYIHNQIAKPLEAIATNTTPPDEDKLPNNFLDLIFIPVDSPLHLTTGFPFSVSRPYLTFLGQADSTGLGSGGSPKQYGNIESLLSQPGRPMEQKSISVRPGQRIFVPLVNGRADFLFYAGITSLPSNQPWTFVSHDRPFDFNFDPSPFHWRVSTQDPQATGQILKAAVNGAGDIFVTAEDPLPVKLDQVGGNNKVRLIDASGDEADIGTGGGDGAVTSTNGIQVYNRNSVFNGSLWDRMRGTTAGTWVDQVRGKSILRAGLNFNTNGNNTLVSAAGGGIKIKVLFMFLYSAAAVTIKITNGAGGSNLIGDINLTPGSGGGFVLQPAPIDEHWIETSANTALVANLSFGVQVGGCVGYITEA